jgi:protocatechuate 3,4-dioxygenase beta subunit
VATVVVTVTDRDVHRGYPLHVAGTVRADGEPCAHAAVELWLRRARGPAAAGAGAGSDPGSDDALRFGTAATGDDGAFTGGGVVPVSASLGDYDVVATTPGDSRCGAGRSVP